MEPSREEVDTWAGGVILEFGSETCSICRAIEPTIERAVAAHPAVRHVKIQDGSGRPLGRSFGVKLWPTLVVLRDGHEVARLVRPRSAAEINAAIDKADA